MLEICNRVLIASRTYVLAPHGILNQNVIKVCNKNSYFQVLYFLFLRLFLLTNCALKT